MRPRLVGLVAMVACAAPRQAPRPALPPAVAPGPAPYLLPPATPPPPFHLACRRFSADPGPPPNRGRKIYEFAPMPLAPVRRGPRTADRPRLGVARTTRELRALFARSADPITRCWQYQSARDPRPTSLEVGVTIDPFGATRELTVTSARPDDAPLIACVRSSLDRAAVTGVEPRTIRLTATLSFVLADQPAWRQLPALPVIALPPDPRVGAACTPVLDDGVIAEVQLASPLTVSDDDRSRDRPNRIVPVRVGCAETVFDADKHAIRLAVDSNYGAFQACYADAFERDPTLAGEVSLRTELDRDGRTLDPQITGGVGDPALHTCLVAAAAELWVAPGAAIGQTLEVHLTFALTPRPASAPPAGDPDAALAAGDADAALAAWAVRLGTATTPDEACGGRAGVVTALAARAPWLDDARLARAIRELATAAAALAPDRAKACVARVAPVISALVHLGRLGSAGPQLRDARQLTHVWLDRYETALPLAPYLDGGNALRRLHAEALQLTPRAAEGRRTLAELARDPELGAELTELARQRADRIEMIADTCRE